MMKTILATTQADVSAEGIIAQLVAPETLVKFFNILVQFIIVMIMITIMRKVALKLIDKTMKNRLTASLANSNKITAIEEKRLTTLQRLFKSIISYTLYFMGIITCLDIVDIKVTTILAGAGILSLAVAFGAQSIVQDLMSGLFIILENQYAVGEYVKIGSVTGKVEEIGMKTTKLSTYNGEIMIIPNGKIAELINYSRHAQRGNVDVGIAYEESIDQAIAVMTQACEAINEQFGEIIDEKANVVGITALAESNVILRATFTAHDWQQVTVERALRKAVKDALDAANVEISYPKIQVVKA